MTIRVLLVDEHEQFANSLRSVLQFDADIEVVALVNSAQTALEAMTRMPVDVVCVDMHIAGLGGIGTTRLLLQRFPQTRVIGLAIHDDPVQVHAMIEAGASGFVLNMDAGRDLAQAIRRLDASEIYLSHSMIHCSACTASQGTMSIIRPA